MNNIANRRVVTASGDHELQDVPRSSSTSLKKMFLDGGSDASLEVDDPESRRVAAALLRHHNSELQHDESEIGSSEDDDNHDHDDSDDDSNGDEDASNSPNFAGKDSSEFLSFNNSYSLPPPGLHGEERGTAETASDSKSRWLPSASKSMIADYRTQIKCAESGQDRYALKGPFWLEVGGLREESEILRCELKTVRLQRQVQDLKHRISEVACRLFYRTAFGCHSSQQDAYVYRMSQQVCTAIESTVSQSTSISCVLLHLVPACDPSDSMINDFGVTDQRLDLKTSAEPSMEASGQSTVLESTGRYRIAAASKRLTTTLGLPRSVLKHGAWWNEWLIIGAGAKHASAAVVSKWLRAVESDFHAALPLEDQYRLAHALHLRGRKQFGGSRAALYSGIFTPMVICNQLYIVANLEPMLVTNRDGCGALQATSDRNTAMPCAARLQMSPQLACYKTHDGSIPAASAGSTANPESGSDAAPDTDTPSVLGAPAPLNVGQPVEDVLCELSGASKDIQPRQVLERTKTGLLQMKTSTRTISRSKNDDSVMCTSSLSSLCPWQPTAPLLYKLGLWETLHEMFRQLASTAIERLSEAYGMLESPSYHSSFFSASMGSPSSISGSLESTTTTKVRPPVETVPFY